MLSVSCLLKSAFNGEYNVKTQFGKREHGLVCSLLLFASNRLGLLRLRRSSILINMHVHVGTSNESVALSSEL